MSYVTEIPGMGSGGASNMSMTMTTDMAMKILKRVGDLTTVETHVDAPKITVPPGSPFGAMIKGSVAKSSVARTGTTKMDRHFGVHDVTGAGSTFSGAFGGISFPSHPIHIGDSWDVSMDMGKLMGAVGQGVSSSGKIKMTYTLTGIRQVEGKSVALLSESVDSTNPMNAMGQSVTMHMKGKGTSSIDVATGMFRSSKVVMEISVAMQGHNLVQHMTQSLDRQ
jgi:hypothetical protein